MPGPTAPRSLHGLLGAQFLGMFNDNFLKMVVVLLMVGPERTEAAQQSATFHAFLAYTCPYILLSLPAGVLADLWSKRRVALVCKSAELAVVSLSALALAHDVPWAWLTVLALLGAQSAVFSPAKYGILPELLPTTSLSRGNGLFLLVTWLAIITGTGLGGYLLEIAGDRRWLLGVLLACVAAGGILFALRIPKVPAARRAGGLRVTALHGWRAITSDRSLSLAVMGSVYFWTIGALLQQDLVVYAKSEHHLSDTKTSILQAALAFGIGVGSLLAGLASRGRLGVHFVPLGAAAMAVLLAVLGATTPAFVPAAALLLGLGVAGGFFVVPVNSVMQHRAPAEDRGAVIAWVNVFVFSGILAGSTLGTVLAGAGLASTAILLVAAGASALGAGVAFWAVRSLKAEV